MPSAIDPLLYKLRAAQPDFARAERQALGWLAQRMGRNCYVSWSAGKDSMVAAHLARRIWPEAPILMSDPGAPIHWTEEDRARMLGYADAQGWRVTLFPWDKFSDTTLLEDGLAEEQYRARVHSGQFAALAAYAAAHGLHRRITGMRAEESAQRRIWLRATRGETAHTLQPIAFWPVDFVWAYTVRHGLPWLSIYDHLGPTARNGLLGRNGQKHGRLAYLKRFYPDAYRLACELLPEARNVI